VKYLEDDGDFPVLELTRRNLTALLAKLDGHPPGSARSLIDPDRRIMVRAVEDAAHYADRPPGPVHEDTAAVTKKMVAGGRRAPTSEGGRLPRTRRKT
jgi:hypothetical protein